MGMLYVEAPVWLTLNCPGTIMAGGLFAARPICGSSAAPRQIVAMQAFSLPFEERITKDLQGKV
jgi:hypothetical protein